ncbi:MAG: thiamine-phosphate kinase [Rhizobiales bacterium]|nr:thiamine-phosphate kinase [Hyphomicrobiales bacterium]
MSRDLPFDKARDARGRPGEFEVIDTFFAPLAASAIGAYGLKDDAAIWQPTAGHDLVLTVDMLVESVHFLPTDPADLVARKLLRVNLSDLAAKGASPLGYLLALSLPARIDGAWLSQFAEGLALDQRAYGVSLWGGDTVSTDGPLTLSVTAVGQVPTGQALRRGGGQVGDDIFVTGTIGDGALGLKAATGMLDGLDEASRAQLIQRYQLPEPRVAFGPDLLTFATAALDVSDGLMADLGHLCDVSGTGATVEANCVPLSEPVARLLDMDRQHLVPVLTGGDDYEILFTARPGQEAAIQSRACEKGLRVTRIGTLTDKASGLRAVDRAGAEIVLAHRGYTHF